MTLVFLFCICVKCVYKHFGIPLCIYEITQKDDLYMKQGYTVCSIKHEMRTV